MALGGETVGEAYIRILADGSGLDRDIRKEWKRHEPEFDDAGRRSNAAFRKGWDEEQKKRPNNLSIINDLRRGRGQFESVGNYLGHAAAKNLRKTMEKELGDKDLARRIFKNLSEEARRTGDLGVFKKGLTKNLPAEIGRAVKQIQEANAKIVQDDKKLATERRRIAATTEKEFEKLIIRRSQLLERTGHKDSDDELRRLRARVAQSVKELRKGDKEASVILRRLLSNFNDHAERDLVKTTGFFRRTNREMTTTEQRARRMNKEFDKFANTIGKAFGAGARNNFFNALGKSVEGVTRLVTGGVPRIIGTLGELGSEFRLAGRRTDEFGNKISTTQRILNVLDTALQNTDQFVSFLAKGIVGAVGGFGAFFAIAAPLAAALSSLAAVVVALSGAIAFGLAGAIGALLPILGAVAAAAVVLGIAFAGLDKKQKTLLKNRLKPLVNDFKQLRDATRNALFSDLGKQVPLAAKLMKSLVPVFQGVGRALAQSFTGFLKMLDSPAFKKNFDSMRKFFPEAVTKLGHIFTNVFSGMSSLLRALVPFANKLLDALTKSTDRFAKFANSARGQNRIKDFMDRAWESAVKLWHTFRDLGRVLGDLFSAGRGPGNGLLDSINSSLERFDRFLKSSKGQAALRGWFGDMKTFLHALGDLLKGVGKLFAALDSPQGHKILNALISGLGSLFQYVAKLIPPFLQLAQQVIPPLAGAFKILFGWVKPLFEFLSHHQTTAKAVALSIIALSLAMKGLLLAAKVGAAVSLLSGTALTGAVGGFGRRLATSIGVAATGIGGKVRILASALAGLSVIMAGGRLGDSVGGNAGKAVTIGSSIAGGALIGSAFGPEATAIGALGGAIYGISKAWGDTGKKAKAAKDIAIQAMQEQKNAALDLAEAIRNAGGDNMQAVKDTVTKGLTGSLSQYDPKKKSKEVASALDIADKAGIELNLLQQAALGVPGAMGKVTDGLYKAAAAGKITGDQSYLTAAAIQEMSFRAEEGELEFEKQAKLTGDLKFALIPLTEEVKKYGTALGTHTAASRRNEFVIKQQASAIRDAATAHVRTAGAAVLATAKLLTNEAAFRKAAIAAGFDKKLVDSLTAAYFKVPTKVATLLEKTGVTPDQIQAIITKYHGIPKGLITALSKKGVTPGEIQAIIDKYLGIPKSRNTDITAKDYATRVINGIKQRIYDLNGKTVYINAVYSTSGDIKKARGGILMAAGGILNKATKIRPGITAGEAGTEAVVPLNRPLSQVDPSVRALSAFAQGLDNSGKQMASGGVVGGGKSVVVEKGAIALYAPVTDPHAAAQLILDGIATKGGYG